MIEAAIASTTSVYTTNVKASPESVPFGIDLLGFFKSPDMLEPLFASQLLVTILPSFSLGVTYANMPPVAGNRIPKRS